MPHLLQAALSGCSRLLRARRILIWLWVANLLFALPLAAVVADSVRRSIGASRVGEELLEGLDLVWHSEYQASTDGIGGSLSPSQVGVGAFLDNLELWFGGELFALDPGLVAAGCLYALLWALLLGGTLVYLQSGERPTVRAFFGFGGEFFLRFVRLTVILAGAYYSIYRFSGWLFRRIEYQVRDVTVEKTVLIYYLAAAVLVIAMLALVRMISDYAKVAMIVEDRRSALLAAWRGLRFVLGQPFRTSGLVLLVAAAGAAVLGVYSWVSPGVGQSSWLTVVAAFLVGQFFLIVRLGLRLTLLGGEIELYERSTPFGGPVEDDRG